MESSAIYAHIIIPSKLIRSKIHIYQTSDRLKAILFGEKGIMMKCTHSSLYEEEHNVSSVVPIVIIVTSTINFVVASVENSH